MIILYTDGSCHHTDKLGTWGAVISTLTTKKLLFGTSYPTTISRMELTPMVEAMRWIHLEICHKACGHPLHIVSDSECTVKCISGLNEPSKNLDLWASFDYWKSKFNLTVEWRGRNTEAPMQICDSTAHALRTYLKERLYKGLTEYELDFPHES